MTVATAPTVYGIETWKEASVSDELRNLVATAPTVYGIETLKFYQQQKTLHQVATAPTVYGIETGIFFFCTKYFMSVRCNSTYRLRY